jgi:peptidoglycan/xylan/chitin deacetylase (PgdA/CDA1 family)
MKLFKRFFFSGISRVNIEWLKKKSPVEVLIPYHHIVSDKPVPYIGSLYNYKNSRQFEDDLDFLLKHFEPVSLTDIINQQKNNIPFKKKSFLITFDDGLRQMYEIAAPVLLKKGVPAALFVNPAFVDNKEIFFDIKKGLILNKLADKKDNKNIIAEIEKIFSTKISSQLQLAETIKSINYLNKGLTDTIGKLLDIDFEKFSKEVKPFMTTTEIKDLINKGFHIGAHSIDHPLYSLIHEKEQIRQTIESVNWVVNTFNLSYKTFAFPHTSAGVKNSFFQQLVEGENPKIDLILGNSTGMLENHPRVMHRFIGENPDIPIDKMCKSVLAYSAINKMAGRKFVKRA